MTPGAYLVDLLMATMNSPATWAAAAGDDTVGLAWRDRVTELMIAAERYRPYDALVQEAARELDLPAGAGDRLQAAWERMEPWPDAWALAALDVPFAFVTNCSDALSAVAVERSGLHPAFTLSAEAAGWFKPRREIYRAALERIGGDSAGTRFIAGAPYDAIGAAAAGLPAMLVVRRPLTTTLRPAVRVCDSLNEAVMPS